jgi:putative transposase
LQNVFPAFKARADKEKIYGTREEARNNVFDYIEMFYNSRRRHTSSDQMSPNEDEQQYYQRLGSF